ncbi:MAG: hypothetical protein IPN03_18475 [Holophagales bacterium]|nr:hypothetical protein [Holophagales bacterium]
MTAKRTAPHEVPPGLLRAAEAVLCKAWEEIQEPGNAIDCNPSTALEDEITFALQRRLLDTLYGEPKAITLFSKEHFSSVERGAEVPSWDGKSIKKKPDLVFRLSSTRPYRARHEVYGIFAECKLIEPGKGIDLYCKEGLKRYVIGEYGWSMQAALMLAYVRKCDTTPKNLGKYLLRRQEEFSVLDVGAVRPCCEDRCEGEAIATKHDRPGVAADDGRPSGAIQVTHLWLFVKVSQN